MPTTADLLQAKQVLSARLLRAGLQSGVVGMRATFVVHTALESARRNVHAVGIGRKIVNEEATQTRCIRLYVVQKLAESLLPPRDRLPKDIEGIPVDVLESPPAFILTRKSRVPKKLKAAVAVAPACTANRYDKQRPVIAGISTAHFDVTAGTLGYFCRSTQHGDDPSQVHVLSNNHVYANVNKAAVGDDLYQPGPADGGASEHHLADLHRYVEIKLGGTSPNRVDAAIGTLHGGVSHRLEVCSIGKIRGVGRAVQDMQIRKHGRTTGYTEGIVTDEFYDALVGMDHNDPSVVALFENQMRLEPVPPHQAIGLGGDSGSLVVMKSEPKAIGLYFAGPEGGAYGVANHIQDVLNELEIELL